jgi:hydrogenase expression/formation protein HypE
VVLVRARLGKGIQGHQGSGVGIAPGLVATDAHVVSPIFFPGGDLGCLAVHGTLNDVAMQGARPLYLSASFILEEGYPLIDLQRIANSMGAAAREAGVPIVTGDTKVVEQGKGDGVFISTTGVGVVAPGVHIGGDQARAGDVVLVSGTLGEHGVAVAVIELPQQRRADGNFFDGYRLKVHDALITLV